MFQVEQVEVFFFKLADLFNRKFSKKAPGTAENDGDLFFHRHGCVKGLFQDLHVLGTFVKYGERGGIKVVFAGHNSSADAHILRRVRQSRDRRGWLVVTNDRDLATAVSDMGARVQSASEFAKELEAPAAAMPDWREKPLSADEVDAWLAVFKDPSQASPSETE